jgi:hypothetical protein
MRTLLFLVPPLAFDEIGNCLITHVNSPRGDEHQTGGLHPPPPQQGFGDIGLTTSVRPLIRNVGVFSLISTIE